MKEVSVALIGAGFMGKAHSQAYRSVSLFFPHVAARPKMAVICDNDATKAESARTAFGWEEAATDWEKVVARDDIDLVDICTPGYLHCPMAVAAAENQKMVLCEKPLANTVEEAERMVAAVEGTGVKNMVEFNYRRVPAVSLAKHLIDDGILGQIYHFWATYLADWMADPDYPLVWRLQRALAGSGSLGDLGAHIIDLSHYLVGPVTQVTGLTQTFIERRPRLGRLIAGHRAQAAQEMGEVDVDDSAAWLARFASGMMGSFKSSRIASGRLNLIGFEINGSRGSLAFDFERMNELELFVRDDPEYARGFRTIHVTDASQPYASAYWPAGLGIGYEHSFINTFYDLLEAIGHDAEIHPDFRDGLYVQKVLAAVERSALFGKWEEIR